jgi:hypothetical protein
MFGARSDQYNVQKSSSVVPVSWPDTAALRPYFIGTIIFAIANETRRSHPDFW